MRLSKIQKQLIGALVLILTVLAFAVFASKNPALFTRLRDVSLLTIASLIALYACFTAMLVGVYEVTTRLCGKSMKVTEQALLTAYSSLINFFGPLQSGPAFRAAYLKQRIGLKLRAYAGVMLIYYAFYAGISGAFLVIGSGRVPMQATIPLLIFCAGIGTYLLKKKLPAKFKPNASLLLLLGLFTLLQLGFNAIIYGVELQAIGLDITLLQVLAYSGAANLALFVSLTPGAIGFRESFLAFTQQLHGINLDGIVAANLLDRGVYVLYLGLLFLVISVFHGKKILASRMNEKASKM